MSTLKEVTADVVALKSTSAIAASLLDTLVSKVEELTSKCIELEGRASNMAARMTHVLKVHKGEITSLRSRLEALEPKARVAAAPRLSTAEFDAGLLSLRHGDTASREWFGISHIRNEAQRLIERAAPMAVAEDVAL